MPVLVGSQEPPVLAEPPLPSVPDGLRGMYVGPESVAPEQTAPAGINDHASFDAQIASMPVGHILRSIRSGQLNVSQVAESEIRGHRRPPIIALLEPPRASG